MGEPTAKAEILCPKCGHPESEHSTDAATGTTRTCSHGGRGKHKLGSCQCIRAYRGPRPLED